MQFSVFISSEHNPGPEATTGFAGHVEQIRLAREVGFDGVAMGNHLSYGETVWFPTMETLMRIAPEAEGMKMATCVLILPLYHPLLVAQQAALLDIATGGRFTLGVAPGWQQDEFKVLGIDFKTRMSRFRESVELIRRVFTEKGVTFAGKHFNTEDLTLVLQPLQKPRPPMWFGGSVEPAIKRAAELTDTAIGDTWVASAHLHTSVIAGQANIYREELDRLGKPQPKELPLLRNIVVAPDKETAIREAGPYLAASYKVFGQWGVFSEVAGLGKSQLELEELLNDRIILGSPEEVTEQLLELAEATGFQRLITRIQWVGMEQRIVLRTIELLGTKVLPALRKELG
jgi:alkanesulfonate monooxygenase SsuD/methylene tetrahydromethanopterin reductase-like flavin-dependent oxidoreductase (luciferase family)